MLLDYAESPRTGDWTLRSALVRLAQPEPLRASAVLELIRRTDGALHAFRNHPSVGGDDVEAPEPAAPLLGAARALDELAEALCAWADARSSDDVAPPVDVVDAACRSAFDLLAEAGVPREERTGRPPGRRRG